MGYADGFALIAVVLLAAVVFVANATEGRGRGQLLTNRLS